MQKTLCMYSITLILNVRIFDIPKLSTNAKGYLISQDSERGDTRKNYNSHVNCLFTYMFTGLLFITKDI